MFVAYVELHAHTAFSFLDGASSPATSWRPPRRSWARGDGGDRPQRRLGLDGVRAWRPSRSACGRSTGWRSTCWTGGPAGSPAARRTCRRGTSRCWSRTRRAGATCAGSSRARTCTTGTRSEPPPAVPLETLEEHAAGLVCLSGCADHGVHDEPTLRRLLAAFGPDHLRVELQRPFQRHDRARNRALAQLARRLGVPTVATGNVHAHARSRAPLQDAFVALRHHLTLDASEPVRRGNTAHVLASPQAMAARFEGHAAAVAESGRAGRAAALRPDGRTSATAIPGAEDPQASRKLAELCWAHARGALPAGLAQPRRGARAAERGAAGDRRARPRRASSCCTATCWSSRATSRSRCAGRRRRARCCRRGAAAGPRCPRSSATSPASRTSTRSRTTCSSAASSTRSSTRCRTSTWTSRATCARS